MGYRVSRQASTKQSPFYMLFQQQMRLPIDAELIPFNEKEEENEEMSHATIDMMVEALLESRKIAFNKADANIAAAQKKQKETYDRKHQPAEFTEGTEVLLENAKQKQQKGGKCDPLWLGPYLIHNKLGKGVYELRRSYGVVIKAKANVNRLKPYIRRCDVENEEVI